MGTAANLSIGPGLLTVAPAGTTLPTNATSALDADFVEIGFTEEGSTFGFEQTNEPIEVAEELEPVLYMPTKTMSEVTFAMAEVTARNLKLAINQGIDTDPITVVEPNLTPVRVILCHQAESGARWLFRKVISAGQISIASKKAPNKRLLAVKFNIEKPATGANWSVWPATDGRI